MGTAIGERTGGLLELSAIIVTFNRGPTLLRTLESVLAQSPAAREVIVVDQTREHEPAVRNQLRQWSERGDIQRMCARYTAASSSWGVCEMLRAMTTLNRHVRLYASDWDYDRLVGVIARDMEGFPLA